MRRFGFLAVFLIISIFARSQGRQELTKSIGFTVSLPWINNYYYYDYDLNQSSSKTGFTGLGAAAFYNTGKNKYSINFGLTSDLPAPMGAFDYGKEGTRANIGSVFGELLFHRNLLNRVSFIAGLNYISYRFKYTSYVDSLPAYSNFDRTIGITLGGEYRFSRTFSLALFYRPAIISFDSKQYRHLISLDARFDINLWRLK